MADDLVEHGLGRAHRYGKADSLGIVLR
jgi:hypothetical protein